jgi:hypothetical protein
MHLFSEYSSLGLMGWLQLGFRYKRSEDARMALEQMEGFELAGRTVSTTEMY